MMGGAQMQRDQVPKCWAREDCPPLEALPGATTRPVSCPLLAAGSLAPSPPPAPFQLILDVLALGVGQEWASLQWRRGPGLRGLPSHTC